MQCILFYLKHFAAYNNNNHNNNNNNNRQLIALVFRLPAISDRQSDTWGGPNNTYIS